MCLNEKSHSVVFDKCAIIEFLVRTDVIDCLQLYRRQRNVCDVCFCRLSIQYRIGVRLKMEKNVIFIF